MVRRSEPIEELVGGPCGRPAARAAEFSRNKFVGSEKQAGQWRKSVGLSSIEIAMDGEDRMKADESCLGIH